jgi:hypothetical protein
LREVEVDMAAIHLSGKQLMGLRLKAIHFILYYFLVKVVKVTPMNGT